MTFHEVKRRSATGCYNTTLGINEFKMGYQPRSNLLKDENW
jgi:hypothetical protein